MIPIADVQPEVESPLPTCTMPTSDEITEEGFGYFRGTWFIGYAPVDEAQATVREEAEIMEWIDELAPGPDQFEQLASAIEKQDLELIDEPLRTTALARGLDRFVIRDEDLRPLGWLEVGVAGLSHALSTIRCLTAASCRWHIEERSWSDCPVVFFAAPVWRVEILAGLVAAEGCGLAAGRDMLTVYGASIRDTHRLAERILSERGRFRKNPHPAAVERPTRRAHDEQLDLFSDVVGP